MSLLIILFHALPMVLLQCFDLCFLSGSTPTTRVEVVVVGGMGMVMVGVVVWSIAITMV